MGGIWLVVAVAAVAALASAVGGVLGSRRRPSTLLSSIYLGVAGGVLLGTIMFEMLPRAEEAASLWLAAVAFLSGVGAMFGFDLALHHGRTAGRAADQRWQIEQFHRRRPRSGDQVTKLAGGSAAEELIEGVSIGVGAVLQPGLALFVAGSVALDNLSEGLSIGALAAERDEPRVGRRRAVRWTGAIGVSLFTSAVLSWLLLRSVPEPVLGAFIGAGAGGMLYLTVTDLVPAAQERHFQQSSALAAASGVVVAFVVSRLV